MWETGSSMATLSALYPESMGDALSGSIQFQAYAYLMEHWLQVGNAWCIVMNSGDDGGKVPNSGFARSCRGFTSIQSALSVLSAVQEKRGTIILSRLLLRIFSVEESRLCLPFQGLWVLGCILALRLSVLSA